MPNKTRDVASVRVAEVLGDAVASGLDVTLVIASPDGTSVPPGTHVADARCYELTPTESAQREEAKSKRLEVHLITEKARVPEVEEALIRLFDVALSDTGQSRMTADFLLAWWNAEQHGGFDIANLFSLEVAIARDISTVVTHLSLSAAAVYADAFGHKGKMMQLIARWRPDALRPDDLTAG